MDEYNSIHLGSTIDNFDIRITSLETLTNSHTTTLNNLALNKYNKTGWTVETDDLTGNIYIEDLNLDTLPASNYYGKGYYVIGSENTSDVCAYLRGIYITDGRKGLLLETKRTINGSAVYNTLNLMIDNSGNLSVGTSDGTIWCKALGFPKILRGSIGLSNGQATLTFSSAFGAAPTVITNAHGTGTADYSTHPGSVTAGGCKIFGTLQSGSGDVLQGTYSSVHWVAIGTWP